PQAGALAEATRRRRATGGPAAHPVATRVGLELRPRRLREAAALWSALTEARGSEGRDALWEHPDLMPSGSDLDDPEGFVSGGSAGDDQLDLDISQFTEGLEDRGPEAGDGGPGKGGPESGPRDGAGARPTPPAPSRPPVRPRTPARSGCAAPTWSTLAPTRTRCTGPAPPATSPPAPPCSTRAGRRGCSPCTAGSGCGCRPGATARTATPPCSAPRCARPRRSP